MRDHTLRLMDDLFEALDLTTAPVVGHSLGGMFALWYAAALQLVTDHFTATGFAPACSPP